ncbi:MAG: HpaII family restriction endonuclease [Crocinitomicaceae bacterium]
MSFTGNKGEWSELYVLVKLLMEGKLHQSDFDLNKDENNIYEIVKAYKIESDYTLEFDRKNVIDIYKTNNTGVKIKIGIISIDDLKSISEKLFSGIKKGVGKSFSINEVTDFLAKNQIQKLKAPSHIKSDIRLKIYDHRLATETDLGFSIKSLLGGDSTLFNTGKGNNFIFSVKVSMEESIANFNRRTYKPPNNIAKLTYRLKELEELGAKLKFETTQSKKLWRNLKMVDGDLPEILGWAQYYRWYNRDSSLSGVSEQLELNDPLNFYEGQPSEQRLYEYKLKRFLTESAMGMTSETPWLGEYDSFGGVIIAKNDGDIVCFHVYDFNLFRNYLLKNTMFEQPSTGEDENNPGTEKSTGKKYYYGWLYEENNELFIKMNLQIRFK